jgi:hypothetical protein
MFQMCVLLNQHHYVWEKPSWLLSYELQLFSTTEVRFSVCVALFFISWASSLWPDELYAWMGCCFFLWFGQFLWSQSATSFNRAIFFYLWFSSELVFPNNSIVHCIPAYSLSLLLNYHQYIICFVVISHILYRYVPCILQY